MVIVRRRVGCFKLGHTVVSCSRPFCCAHLKLMTRIKPTAAETEFHRVDFGLGDVQTDVASLTRPILEESDVVWL